ncbi:MAG: THxN family PEP-CTERM protein [Armatimonadota bacterium]|nr:THxN family PEP-CTERM protein [Armatimonadota bacterium]
MDTVSVVHARTGFRRFVAPLAGVLLGAALVIAGLIFVQPASAFDYTAGSCNWVNPVGGSNVNYPATGDPCEIRWGVNVGQGQSGYRFNPTPPPAVTNIDIGDAFNLGQFTHFNAPIQSGSSITQVDLSLQVFLSGFNGGISPTFTFRFSHFETPNNPAGGICAGTGIPTPPEGCPDIVTFPSAFATETFTFDDVVYTLQLIAHV